MCQPFKAYTRALHWDTLQLAVKRALEIIKVRRALGRCRVLSIFINLRKQPIN